MSSRLLRKLHGHTLDPYALKSTDNQSDEETNVTQSQNRGNIKSRKNNKIHGTNIFQLLSESDETESNVENYTDLKKPAEGETESIEVENETLQSELVLKPDNKKKRKNKKKKAKHMGVGTDDVIKNGKHELEASICCEVSNTLNNGIIGDQTFGSAEDQPYPRSNKPLLAVEHRNLNPENELKKIFGSRVLREEGLRRRRPQGHRRKKAYWLAQPRDSWSPISTTGLSMVYKESQDNCQYFVFEHSYHYQKIQFQFYESVESLNPQNIGNIIQLQPYHVDALIQLSEVFKMTEDLNMAVEFIERALFSMENAFHPLFNLATGTCRLLYKYRENRCLHLALFKHIQSLGQRGCNRTALEFCKLLLSLDPDNDPLCALLLIDFYAIRAGEYKFLIRLYHEWEVYRNLSQLPNFAFSIPLALYHENSECKSKADQMLQDSLLMFPSLLVPLLVKCGVQADEDISHSFFQKAQNGQSDALKQLIALYVGRCHTLWKLPDVMEWLEYNVKLVIKRVENKDPIIEDYKTKRQSRYNGTPRNIYRHILLSEIATATAAIPQDVASTVLSYDPLPPLDSVEAYTRPARSNRAQSDGNAISMFLRSLLPNFNPNEPVQVEGAEGGAETWHLRQGVGVLMDAMRDLLNNIHIIEHPGEHEGEGAAEDQERDLEEWD